MRNLIFLSLIGFMIGSCGQEKTADTIEKTPHHKIPTQVVQSMENEEEFDARKKQYWDYIHGSQTNWREVNRENFLMLYEQRLAAKSSRAMETFADGQFDGEWSEKGSTNQAGNVRITDFDKNTDDVYAISDGGTLWKGNLDGVSWTPLNDDIVFNPDVLKVVPLAGGGLRILAPIGAGLWYSDDDGANWIESTGISPFPDQGRGIDIVQLNDADSTIVYLCYRSDGPSSFINSVLYSIDDGETFTLVQDLSTANDNHASMAWPYDTDHAYILDSDEDTYLFTGTGMTPIASGLSIGGTSSMQLEASHVGATTTLYSLMNGSQLYTSTDNGLSFNFVSTLPTSAWNCGIGVSAEDPNYIYYGEVELYRSTDAGLSFVKVADWFEYYGDVANKIHADIMDIRSFKKSDGSEFTLLCNHGGISTSYDYLATTPNIGMADLNVGQLYDVLTSTINPNFIYGGTQDQGFLRTSSGGSVGPTDFEQVISGDYGQMQLSNNGASIWTQYPGADFAFYENAMTDGGPTSWFDVGGTDMPNWNWIVPTGPAADPSDTYIYVGGGNVSGGSGSHLIKLNWDGFSFDTEQYDYDFLIESGEPISAIETTPLRPDFIYVSTGNGRFYRSENGGDDFIETPAFFGAGSSWIYGADIYASRSTPGMVFLGGSAGGPSSVYMSLDSGQTFTPISSGLPSTMVHELTMNSSEEWLFAATDAGPYVYSLATNEWYSILGDAAPLQEYISVEYIISEDIVRFGTWGRGIWDLKLDVVNSVGIEDEPIESVSNTIAFPNPANQTVNLFAEDLSKLQLVNTKGQILLESLLSVGKNEINVSHLPNGVYISRIGDIHGKVSTETLVIQH